MGLDMYIEKCNKFEDPNNENVVKDEIAYWRKANQIRQWIVDHTDYPDDADCEYHMLAKSDIEALLKDVKTVLEDHSKAEELLPTQSGFFFGSTDYDEYYFSDLEDTVEQLENILNDVDFETEDIYYYEWW